MKSIYIDDELHRATKRRAAELGISLKEYIEGVIRQGLPDSPPAETAAPRSVREAAPAYVVPPRVDDAAESDAQAVMDRLIAKGLLIPGEQIRDQIEANYLRMRRELGLSDSPPTDLPSIDEVRAIFQRQRELYPDVPTVGELLRQMREEE